MCRGLESGRSGDGRCRAGVLMPARLRQTSRSRLGFSSVSSKCKLFGLSLIGARADAFFRALGLPFLLDNSRTGAPLRMQVIPRMLDVLRRGTGWQRMLAKDRGGGAIRPERPRIRLKGREGTDHARVDVGTVVD